MPKLNARSRNVGAGFRRDRLVEISRCFGAGGSSTDGEPEPGQNGQPLTPDPGSTHSYSAHRPLPCSSARDLCRQPSHRRRRAPGPRPPMLCSSCSNHRATRSRSGPAPSRIDPWPSLHGPHARCCFAKGNPCPSAAVKETTGVQLQCLSCPALAAAESHAARAALGEFRRTI